MIYVEQFLSTPFGDFDIHISSDSKNKEADAIEELKKNLWASDCREAYYDDNGKIYAVDVGFYYGSKYVELDEVMEDENEATITASEFLIEELENHF